MGSYSVRIISTAEKELKASGKTERLKLIGRIQALTHAPRPAGCEKLSGEERYRVRHGDWRIVYSIDDAAKVVLIVKIGHRREVYR